MGLYSKPPTVGFSNEWSGIVAAEAAANEPLAKATAPAKANSLNVFMTTPKQDAPLAPGERAEPDNGVMGRTQTLSLIGNIGHAA